jgi:hypothetical protein
LAAKLPPKGVIQNKFLVSPRLKLLNYVNLVISKKFQFRTNIVMQKFYRLAAFSTFFLILHVVNISTINAQDSKSTPEMSVVGVKLGDRESAKKYLLPGHIPRVDEEGRVSYFFYNEWGTQVMRLTVASVDDPYFVTEIEVMAVGKSYQKRHYQDNENGLMMTENGIFIGFRQTAMNFIIGIRNAGKANTISPDEVVKIKGAPKTREKVGEKGEVITYSLPDVTLTDDDLKANYEARYEFSKNKLSKFSLKIKLDSEKLAKK